MRGVLAAVSRATVLLVLAVVIVLPVVVTVVSGLRLSAIRDALEVMPLGRQYLVSASVVALQTGAQMITAALAAYALVFPTWRGRTVAFVLILATLAVPGESTVIPNLEIVGQLGMRDTVLGVVLPYLAAGFPVFLLRQAFRTVPHEVWEAARLDGAGHVRTLFTIVLPLVGPQAAAAAMWCALAAWNGYFWPLLVTDSTENRTVQVGLGQLVTSEATSPSVVYAGTLLVLLPTLLLVVLGQRFLISGLAGRLRA